LWQPSENVGTWLWRTWLCDNSWECSHGGRESPGLDRKTECRMAAPGPARWRCNHKRRVRIRRDRPRDPPGGWARHSESWRHRHDATISLEGARYGIRAVAISPGSFLTPTLTSATTRRPGTRQPERRVSSASVNPRGSRRSRPSSLLTGRLTSPAPTTRSTAARPLGRATGRGLGGGFPAWRPDHHSEVTDSAPQ
jgi:hypothetical protein